MITCRQTSQASSHTHTHIELCNGEEFYGSTQIFCQHSNLICATAKSALLLLLRLFPSNHLPAFHHLLLPLLARFLFIRSPCPLYSLYLFNYSAFPLTPLSARQCLFSLQICNFFICALFLSLSLFHAVFLLFPPQMSAL